MLHIRYLAGVDLLASRGVGEIFMIRRYLGQKVRVGLQANKMLYIVEEELHKSVVVGHVGKLGVEQPTHLGASRRWIVRLSRAF